MSGQALVAIAIAIYRFKRSLLCRCVECHSFSVGFVFLTGSDKDFTIKPSIWAAAVSMIKIQAFELTKSACSL